MVLGFNMVACNISGSHGSACPEGPFLDFQVTKGMLSWDPPNCLLRRESSIPCGDCDDQVFMVPQKFAQDAVRSLIASALFFAQTLPT